MLIYIRTVKYSLFKFGWNVKIDFQDTALNKIFFQNAALFWNMTNSWKEWKNLLKYKVFAFVFSQ